MRDSLPSARYSPICNVLRQWKTSLILTYRVYRLYDEKLVVADKCLKVSGLSIKSRSSIICIDLSMHVHVVKD